MTKRNGARQGVSSLTLEWPRRLVVLAAFCCILPYMAWRLGTFNPHALIFSYVLYIAEIFGVVSLILHSFMTWRLSVREPPQADPYASVDVFIPTINEPLSVIRHTALTALAMDHPHATWILDDGRRPEVRALADELGCGYLAREGNAHAKAGNLNAALTLTHGKFIAIFDADHAPMRRFLARTLGYFRDPNVAFVQTPQDFYNLDSFQHRAHIREGRLWSEQSLFFRVIQRGKDVWNAAFFCGSCAVIRRSALEAIGGFATGTVTEDLHTSLKLHKAGYDSVYHAESLAFGIAPAQIEPFLRQRVRWGQGAMQVWRREPILFSRKLTLPQKLCYLPSILTYFDGWQKALYYFTPALVLVTGWVPLEASVPAFLWHFVPYLVFSMWASNELGRGYCRTFIIEQYNMARFAAFAYATLGLFRPRLRFRVTNKRLTGRALHGAYLLPQYLVFLLNLVAIPVGTLLYRYAHQLNPFALSVNLIWACLNITLAVAVLAFSMRRMRFRRQDYRFTLPLVANFADAGGHPVTAAVEDVSATGVQLVLEGHSGFAREQLLRGGLRLPGETIPFRAVVRSISARNDSGTASLGCEFLWDDASARQRLELFLYGSDLEWQVHAIHERMPTALERILPRACAWQEPETRVVDFTAYTLRQPMLYAPDARLLGQDEPGIVAFNGQAGKGMAIVFSPLETGAALNARVFTPTGWQNLHARVTQARSVEQAGKTVYFYAFEEHPAHAAIH